MNTVIALALACLLVTTTGCNNNEAAAAFAENARQLSDLTPRVAAVPYNACVDQRLLRQISNAADLPDRTVAAKECLLQAEVRERVAKQYDVLTQYLEIIGKVASGGQRGSQGSVRSIASSAVQITGANSAAQAAAAGLAGAIAAVYLRSRSSAALREAITMADTHVQVLCKAFASEIAPAMTGGLQSEEQQLEMVFNDNRSSGAVHLLLVRQFDSDRSQIEQNRNLVRNYSAVLQKIAAAHAKLYENRNRLNARGALDELMAASDSIASDLKAIYQ